MTKAIKRTTVTRRTRNGFWLAQAALAAGSRVMSKADTRKSNWFAVAAIREEKHTDDEGIEYPLWYATPAAKPGSEFAVRTFSWKEAQ